jgi:chromosome segregation ATPase
MVAPYLSVTTEKLEAWRQDSNNLAKDILLTVGESLMYVRERDKINAEINALKKRIELLEKENQIYDYLLNLANARIQELVEQIVAIRAALEEGVLGNGGKKQPARI